MPLSDEDLKLIYLGARPSLQQFFNKRLRCPDTAADLVQDIYFRLLRLKPIPCTDQEVRNWLFRVAANLTVDHVRVAQRHTDLLAKYQGDESEIDGAATPEENLLGVEQCERLQNALSELPGRCAEILCLSRIEGLTHAQIAARFGISQSLVEKQIRKALDHCRRVMDQEDQDP